MLLVTATATLTNGTPVVLGSLFSGLDKVAWLHVEPDVAATHKVYLGDTQMALGTSLVDHVVRVLEPNSVITAGATDYFEADARVHNVLDLGQWAVDGTTGDKVRVSVLVA